MTITTAVSFDETRALLLDKPQFQPFYVNKTELLERALFTGDVTAETRLLVLLREESALGLNAAHMGYHHLAQGELSGQPWLVTF